MTIRVRSWGEEAEELARMARSLTIPVAGIQCGSSGAS